MQQARDYLIEAANLAQLLETLSSTDLAEVTQFKGWTIEDVIGHLYLFDTAALVSVQNTDEFESFFAPIAQDLANGRSFLQAQQPWLNGLCGQNLINEWRKTSLAVGNAYASVDPKARLKWAGPDMSARSAITARQMETWAHGQEIYDILGVERTTGDHIRNICHLGVSTFSWTFANRGWDIPKCQPKVRLSASSGEIWEWDTPNSSGQVSGKAKEFAQVVTQVRNIADTTLICDGAIAEQWMKFAQCFAGPPIDPPLAGTRFCAILKQDFT